MAFQKGNIPWNKNESNPFTKGENNYFWRGGKVQRVCIRCGEKFEIFPSEIKRRNRKYCSHRCYSEDNKGGRHWWSCFHSAKYKLLKSKQNSGEGNPNWQGGISFEIYPEEWTEKLKRKIRERDNYTCRLCGKYGNIVHHIDYNKKNCNPNNLITLCRRGNAKVNYNREHWTDYFLKPMEIRDEEMKVICECY